MELPNFLILPYDRCYPQFGPNLLERWAGSGSGRRQVVHDREVWCESNNRQFQKICDFLAQYNVSDNYLRALIGIHKLCWFYDSDARFASTLKLQPSLTKLFDKFPDPVTKLAGDLGYIPTGYGVVFYFFMRTADDVTDFGKMWQDVNNLLNVAQNEIVIVAAIKKREPREQRPNDPAMWENLRTEYNYRACVVQFDYYMDGSAAKWNPDNRDVFEEMCSVLYDADMREDLAAALKVPDA